MTSPLIRVAHPPHDKPVLLYDGECPFCRRWIIRWRRRTGDAIAYLPSSEGSVRFPEIPADDLAGAVQLIDQAGRVYSGAEAVVRSLSLGAGRRKLLWSYLHVPGFASVAGWIYRWVARSRRRL